MTFILVYTVFVFETNIILTFDFRLGEVTMAIYILNQSILTHWNVIWILKERGHLSHVRAFSPIHGLEPRWQSLGQARIRKTILYQKTGASHGRRPKVLRAADARLHDHWCTSINILSLIEWMRAFTRILFG